MIREDTGGTYYHLKLNNRSEPSVVIKQVKLLDQTFDVF